MTDSTANATQLMVKATQRLRQAGHETAGQDVRRLMAHALAIPADRLTLHLHDPVSEAQAVWFLDLIEQRKAGKPVSHLVGGRQFYGRWFAVTSDVLDPRPETETLIEVALSAPFARVLDLGTGSGAIAITLAAECKSATVVAVDISAAALEVAQQNARALQVEGQIDFRQSDWCANVTGRFDLIVSNPPYIALDEMDGLQKDVRVYEPRIALTDEADGLSAYRRIAAEAPSLLADNGRLIVEIGPTQAAQVTGLFAGAGLEDLQVISDLDGRDRVVAGTWKSAT